MLFRSAFCQIQPEGHGFSIFAQEGGLGTIEGRPVHASVDSFSNLPPPGGGGPAPAPQPGGDSGQIINAYVSLFPRGEADAPREWHANPESGLELDATADGLAGTLTFEALQSIEFEGQPGTDEGSISGSITWTCE